METKQERRELDEALHMAASGYFHGEDGEVEPFEDGEDKLQAIAGLLAAGADPDFSGGDWDGWAPLHHAAASREAGCIAALLAAGADPDVRGANGGTPLFLAARGGAADCVDALLGAGADPMARDGARATPLHMAAAFGQAECVDALISAGADPDARDKKNATPLHRAAESGKPAAVANLLAARAVPDAEDSEGRTPAALNELLSLIDYGLGGRDAEDRLRIAGMLKGAAEARTLEGAAMPGKEGPGRGRLGQKRATGRPGPESRERGEAMEEKDKGFRLESLKELGWPDDHRLLESGRVGTLASWLEASWGDGKGRGGEGGPEGMVATLRWDADADKGSIGVVEGLEIAFMADVVLDDEGLFVRDAWGPGADGQRSPMAAKDAAEAFKTAVSLLTPVVPKRTTRRDI